MTSFRLDISGGHHKSLCVRFSSETCKPLSLGRSQHAIFLGTKLNSVFGCKESPIGNPLYIRGISCTLRPIRAGLCLGSQVGQLEEAQPFATSPQTCAATLRRQPVFLTGLLGRLLLCHQSLPDTNPVSRTPDTCSSCSPSPNPNFASNAPMSIPAFCIHSRTESTLARR